MHISTALVYVTFTGLAIASFATSQALFRDKCILGEALYCPLHFCGFTSGAATIQAATANADVGCFNKVYPLHSRPTPYTLLLPTTLLTWPRVNH